MFKPRKSLQLLTKEKYCADFRQFYEVRILEDYTLFIIPKYTHVFLWNARTQEALLYDVHNNHLLRYPLKALREFTAGNQIPAPRVEMVWQDQECLRTDWFFPHVNSNIHVCGMEYLGGIITLFWECTFIYITADSYHWRK